MVIDKLCQIIFVVGVFSFLCVLFCLKWQKNYFFSQYRTEKEFLYLSKAGLAESSFWLPIQYTISQPDKPRLSAENFGLDFTFCVSVDFAIDENGYVSQWNIIRSYPKGFEKEISRNHFKNMSDWRFSPSNNNIGRQKVISNRVFVFNLKPGVKINNCFGV